MLSSRELSEKWGIGQCRIARLAREGRIPGAQRYGMTWLFPEDTQKPADARTRAAKTAQPLDASGFRCTFLEFRDEASFDPPLSAEERTVKQATEAFYACRFQDADAILGDLPETAANRYCLIMSLYCGCMTDIMLCNTQRFLRRYAKLSSVLCEAFPHKLEMKEYLYGIQSVLGADDYYRDAFDVDPNYLYDESFLSRLANLSSFQFTLASSAIHISDLRASEVNCMFLEHSDAYADLVSIHTNLGVAYGMIGQTDRRDLHLGKALLLAERREIYFPIALNNFYFVPEMFNTALKELPEEFGKLLARLSEDAHYRFVRFMEAISGNSVYMSLRPDDFAFLSYAMQGLTNKEIAARMHTSTSFVSKRYGEVYAALGVRKKQEMLALYEESLKRAPLTNDLPSSGA